MPKPIPAYSDEDITVRVNFLITARERNQFFAACQRRDRTMSLMLRDMVRAVIAEDAGQSKADSAE